MRNKLHRFNESGQQNGSLRGIQARLGNVDLPHYQPSTVSRINENADLLQQKGGFAQQHRMIRDKRHSLDMATLYSYQAALIRKWLPPHEGLEPPETEAIVPESACELLLPPVRALINPNKLTTDYDNKIVSVGFEHGFKPGDIFKWCQTNTFWIIYLQDLQELAYFRGDIRKCSYQVAWLDEEGNKQLTYIAVRGPVETKIDFIQKHTISVDNPNHSLNILMPKNPWTMQYFKRYSKFYLKGADNPDNEICWRVEATDSISTPGILEVVAVEYYNNEFKDDIEDGLVDALVLEPIDPNEGKEEMIDIKGETFTKPFYEGDFYVNSRETGEWSVVKRGKKVQPVKIEPYRNEVGYPCAKVTWIESYSGQFELVFKGESKEYTKTIVVESLF